MLVRACLWCSPILFLLLLFLLFFNNHGHRRNGRSNSSSLVDLSRQLRRFSAKSGNSVVDCALYRLFLLHLFPALVTIDGVSVTQGERTSAAQLFLYVRLSVNPFVRSSPWFRSSVRTCSLSVARW